MPPARAECAGGADVPRVPNLAELAELTELTELAALAELSELTALAERMTSSTDPLEVARLREEISRGFYGGR